MSYFSAAKLTSVFSAAPINMVDCQKFDVAVTAASALQFSETIMPKNIKLKSSAMA